MKTQRCLFSAFALLLNFIILAHLCAPALAQTSPWNYNAQALGLVKTDFQVMDMKVNGNRLYVTDAPSSDDYTITTCTLTVYDIANASSPALLGSIEIAEYPSNYVDFDVCPPLLAFATLNSIKLLDVSDPAHIQQAESILGFTNLNSVAFFNASTLISGMGGAVHFYDVSTPAAPAWLFQLTGVTGPIAVEGDYLVATRPTAERDPDYINVYSLTNPSSPQKIFEFQTTRIYPNTPKIRMQDGQIYQSFGFLTGETNLLQIFKKGQGDQWTLNGTFNLTDDGNFFVHNGLVHLTSQSSWMACDPDKIGQTDFIAASYRTPSMATCVAAKDDVIYVGDRFNGILMLDNSAIPTKNSSVKKHFMQYQ